MNWHTLSPPLVLRELRTSAGGLSMEEASRRLLVEGANELHYKKQKGPLVIFLKQFLDVMILILFVAAAISVIIREYTDAIVVLVIVLLNALIGFYQEYNAEKAMQAIKKLASPTAAAMREGGVRDIPSAELVPGDVVLLEAGNVVPADMRLIEAHSLKINEASLTGESNPVDKITAPLAIANPGVSDYANMVFKGTYVTYGRGTAVVTATGMRTELGKIAEMLHEKEGRTPLQLRISAFSGSLTVLIIVLCVLLFVIGFLLGETPVQMLLLSISLAVAAIPEALPAVITIALSAGARRLMSANVLVRRLYAVETLGSVTYICSDKTGTLTENKMQVKEVWVPGQRPDKAPLFEAMALNHDLRIKDGSLKGDPTEEALVSFAREHDQQVSSLASLWPRVNEIPFDSDRKIMTTVHRRGETFLIVSKGAAESISSICRPLSEEDSVKARVTEMASAGMRVLAFAWKEMVDPGEVIDREVVEADMHFLGVAGLVDPVREEVKEAMKECRSAGINTVMITGDHPATATAIGRELGMIASSDGKVLTGIELEKLSDEEFRDKVEEIRIYARVSPAQKFRIVKMLQRRKHFVAMTGDGVNDAPSVKVANIGIAMGITGTDVTKEVAQMILLDDNFATIVNAVKEGRRIYDNIRKFIRYILAGNTAEIFVIFLAPVLGLPIPLLPVHILWINLITDGLPALALSAEKAEPDVMERQPRKTDESLFAGGLGKYVLVTGVFIACVTLASQFFLIKEDVAAWQTMVFTILCFSQLWQVQAIRSERKLLVHHGIFSNPFLLIAVLVAVALQLAIIYVPALAVFFRTTPLSFAEFLICIIVSSLIFWLLELSKVLSLKRPLQAGM